MYYRPFRPGDYVLYLHPVTGERRHGTITATGPRTVIIAGLGDAQYSGDKDRVWHEASRGPVDPVPCNLTDCPGDASVRLDIDMPGLPSVYVCAEHAEKALACSFPQVPLTV